MIHERSFIMARDSTNKNNCKELKEMVTIVPPIQKFNNFEDWSKACTFMSDSEKKLFRDCVGDNAEYAIF